MSAGWFGAPRSDAPLDGGAGPPTKLNRVGTLTGTDISFAEPESMEKRQRERSRREKQQQKEQRRLERVAEREKRAREGGKDADLKGMVPGPQPGQIVDLP